MKKGFIIGLASVMTLTFAQFSFAGTIVGKNLKESFKTYETEKVSKDSEFKEVLNKKAQFDVLKTSAAKRINKNIADLNQLNSQRTSVNSLKEFALRGQKEIDAIEALIQADRLVRTMENSAGIKAEDRAEIQSLKATIIIQSEFISRLGENPVINGADSRANEALTNLVSILSRLTTEFKAEEREGYNKLMKDMISLIKNGEIPAEALKKALNDNSKLEQLRGCKA